MRTEYMDGNSPPLAVFKFRHCSKSVLKMNNVPLEAGRSMTSHRGPARFAPRTPERHLRPDPPLPVPLEERGFEELNAAENRRAR